MSPTWWLTLPRDVGVVLVAAGSGHRMGGDTPKQFLPVAGIPMLLRALRPFVSHPDVRAVSLVLPEQVTGAVPDWLAEAGGDIVHFVAGGAQRMDSVERGLAGLPVECTRILVHDAARPFVGREILDRVLEQVAQGRGAIAAIRVTDTLKEAEFTQGVVRIRRTVPRDAMWRAQTPQGFPRALLERAYAAAREDQFTGTDEASLVERIGHPVVLVPDSPWNIKVTTPDDLRLAELIASRDG